MVDPVIVAVKDSILQSTKKLIGMEADYDAFDLDIITGINSAFATLYQAGVGPVEGFFIEDGTATWSQFIGNKMHINSVKSYVFFSAKLAFDPPTSSFGLDNIKNQMTELIWRLNVADDFSIVSVVPVEDDDTPVIWTTGSSIPETPPPADDSEIPTVIWSVG